MPLSTCNIGPNNSDPTVEAGWCFLTPAANAAPAWVFTFWLLGCFYIWVWTSVLYMFFLMWTIISDIRKMTSMELRKCAITSMTKLGLYPVIITVGWVINTYQESTYGLYAQYQYGLGGFAFLSVGLPFLIGACCSIVFMVTNRRLLKELILRSAAR